MWVMWPMVLGICGRLSAKSCGSCGQWPWVSVDVFPRSHVDHVANGPGYLWTSFREVMMIMWPMVLGICGRLSAKSCGSCGQWSWVSVDVFPRSHVDHVANGPGYLWTSFREVMWVMWPMVLGICGRLSAKSCGSCGQWSRVSVGVFPRSHVGHVANGPGYLWISFREVMWIIWPNGPGLLWVREVRVSVGVFPRSHVGHVVNGPGYLWTSFREVMWVMW